MESPLTLEPTPKVPRFPAANQMLWTMGCANALDCARNELRGRAQKISTNAFSKEKYPWRSREENFDPCYLTPTIALHAFIKLARDTTPHCDTSVIQSDSTKELDNISQTEIPKIAPQRWLTLRLSSMHNGPTRCISRSLSLVSDQS